MEDLSIKSEQDVDEALKTLEKWFNLDELHFARELIDKVESIEADENHDLKKYVSELLESNEIV